MCLKFRETRSKWGALIFSLHYNRGSRRIQSLKLTVVHNAILDPTICWGKFKVICEFVSWPNIRNPMIAAPPYIRTHKMKLYNSKLNGYKMGSREPKETAIIKSHDLNGEKKSIKLALLPYYKCSDKFGFIGHWMIYIWENWMSWIAKTIDANCKRNATPIYHLTTWMKSNSLRGTN